MLLASLCLRHSLPPGFLGPTRHQNGRHCHCMYCIRFKWLAHLGQCMVVSRNQTISSMLLVLHDDIIGRPLVQAGRKLDARLRVYGSNYATGTCSLPFSYTSQHTPTPSHLTAHTHTLTPHSTHPLTHPSNSITLKHRTSPLGLFLPFLTHQYTKDGDRGGVWKGGWRGKGGGRDRGGHYTWNQ